MRLRSGKTVLPQRGPGSPSAPVRRPVWLCASLYLLQTRPLGGGAGPWGVGVKLIQGDALAVLRSLPRSSVQCCVTSPPYWGLRDYGVEGQLGLEATPEEYVARMVEVFREVRRVLRGDGTLWLNLGDCYATGAGRVGGCPGGGEQGARWRGEGSKHDRGRRSRPAVDGRGRPQPVPPAIGPAVQPNRMPIPGLKPKDLVGIPWRVAFALQADGWYLRSDIIWHKPNPMPESVTDRPTKAHEYLFLMARSERYYYDAEAIKEVGVTTRPEHYAVPLGWNTGPGSHETVAHNTGVVCERRERARIGLNPGAKNAAAAPQSPGRRLAESVKTARANGGDHDTVWTISTQAFPEAHFATFPEALVEPCIAAGSREGDAVLDPFCGSGTVGAVCGRAGRHFIGIELNPEYLEMARRRISRVAPLFCVAYRPPAAAGSESE